MASRAISRPPTGSKRAFGPAEAGRKTRASPVTRPPICRSSYIVPTYYTTSYRTTSYTPTYTPTVFDYPRVWPSSYSTTERRPIATRFRVIRRCWPRPTELDDGISGGVGCVADLYSSSVERWLEAATGDVNDDPTIPSTVGPPPGEPDLLNPVDDAAANKARRVENRADSPPKPPLPNANRTRPRRPAGAGCRDPTPP